MLQTTEPGTSSVMRSRVQSTLPRPQLLQLLESTPGHLFPDLGNHQARNLSPMSKLHLATHLRHRSLHALRLSRQHSLSLEQELKENEDLTNMQISHGISRDVEESELLSEQDHLDQCDESEAEYTDSDVECEDECRSTESHVEN